MKTHRINITKSNIQVALLAMMALVLVPTIARGHGGEEHVIGTVAKISDTSITVKTTAGKLVDVGFDARTAYERANTPIQRTEIRLGDRVVIHAIEVNEKLVAHTVELGFAKGTQKATKP